MICFIILPSASLFGRSELLIFNQSQLFIFSAAGDENEAIFGNLPETHFFGHGLKLTVFDAHHI